MEERVPFAVVVRSELVVAELAAAVAVVVARLAFAE